VKKHKNACFQKAKKKLLRIHKNFPHAHTKEHEHEQLPHKMVQLPPDENNNKSLPITVSLSESEDKARARDLTLLECQQLALEYNFVKENAPSHGTVQQRADVVGFFKQYGANGLSQFKKKFGSMKLYPPGEKEVEFYSSSGSCEDDDLLGSNGDSFLKKPISKEDIEEAIPIYEENKESFKKLNWKYIKRPGGQAIRPPDWYKLEGAVSQVEKGDNDTECPMWTSNGSVDYGGKEQWEWWSKYKGKSADESKVFFVRVLEMANRNKKENFY
jgi:acyl-CoA-binding protein